MDYSAHVLGSSVAAQLATRAGAPLLIIGADTFTRHDLAAIDCFNFLAAANLSRLLTHELGVKNTRDVFEHVAPEGLAIPRLGVVALAVLGEAFEVKGLGGAHPLEAWAAKHRAAGARRAFVTFDTIKQRATARERAAATHARRPRAPRRVRFGIHRRRGGAT